MQNTGAILCVRGGKKQKYGAGSGLAPRAVVLIWVFCQNTRNRPLCSYGAGSGWAPRAVVLIGVFCQNT